MHRTLRYTLALLPALLMPTLSNAQVPPLSVNGPGSTLSQLPRPQVPHSPKLPYGLQLMARFDLLPLLRDTKCVQDSSYDRSGGNGDSGNFLRHEGNTAVLSDIRGPGCIYRFWSANAAGHLKIFFDGEASPRIDCQMQDLFLGKVAPFVQPIVGHKSGGWYSFFPMPFAKGCRIEVTDPGSMYYHVEYQLFPDGTPTRTFTTTLTPEDSSALTTVLKQWAHLGEPPLASLTASHPEAQAGDAKSTLAAGDTRTLATLKGPAEIEAFHFRMTPADRYTLRQTVIRVYWDGAAKPAIEAPVGDFFGVGFGDQRFKSLVNEMTDQGYACYWPMPFARSARIELVNMGKTDLTGISWSVSHRKLAQPPKDQGYFHAQWHRQTTVAGEYFHILQTTGRGQYVGEHTDMQGDRGIGFLEGDEKIKVDADTFPSIYGTGTEDFYTGGWYFDEGPFNLAYHGCTVKDDGMSRVAAYRYQIQDCVPFQHEIKVDIEHGGENDYPGADYSCVAYWYQDSPAHDWSPIVASQLTPAQFKLAGVIEAEDLPWVGGRTQLRTDSTLPVEASDGKFMALIGDSANARSTITLHVDKDEVYQVHFAELLTPDSPGNLELDWPGKPANLAHLTLDRPDTAKGRWDYMLPIRLQAGDHQFTVITPEGKTRNLDYIRLEPVEKQKGVIEAESLITQTVVTGHARSTRRDGIDVQALYGAKVMNGLSGAGLLEWSPSSEADSLQLPLSIPIEGDYELELGIVNLALSPMLTVNLDSGPSIPLDLSHLEVFKPLADNFRVQRVHVTRLPGLKPGMHTLTLHRPAGSPALLIDYMRLQKSLYPHAIEAETLRVLEVKDGDASQQEMAPFGPGWSGDSQLWFLGRMAGAEVTVELPVETTGKYDLSVYYTTARDYGIAQVLIDGKAVGVPTDCYSQDVLPKGKTALGQIDLSAGPHRMTFRAIGKNPASTNFLLGIDAVSLEPVK